MRQASISILFVMLACAVPLPAADAGSWPQFRGARGDGVSRETGLLPSWPSGGPAVVWRAPLGEGYSGISVVGGRLFTMFAAKSDEFAVCLDAATGKELWRRRVDSKWIDRFGNGPRSTPTVDGAVVYVLSANGKLHALQAADGESLWVKDLAAEYGATPPTWGVSASPLVEGKLLLLDVGGKNGSSVVAFDKKTGGEVWRSQDGKAGYSTPLRVRIGDARQVLFFTGSALVALSPTDGKLQWKQPWETSYDVNAATPVFVPPDKIFVSSGYDVGSALLRVHPAADGFRVEQVWKSREMRNKFSSSVLHAGHLYGFDETALKCIDVETGAMRWRSRGFGHGSLLFADGKLVVLGDKGQLALVEATPSEFKEHGRMQLFEGKTWTVPTLSGGRLYVRDEKQLVALDVTDPNE